MKIDNISRTISDGLARVSGTVTWEDCDLPQREIYIETDPCFAEEMSPDPNAFLLAAIIPAMHNGEQRVFVHGKVCPQLRTGLDTAMQLLRHWYGKSHDRLVTIEPSEGFEPPMRRTPERTASFMSGGVDALSTLRSNRRDFPLDHPGSIRDCFFVHGFDIGGYTNLPDNRENSRFAVASLAEFAGRADVTLIPVYTNMRSLDEDDDLFGLKSHGASLASIAHAFSRRISTALIASSYNIDEQKLAPWGSHPLLDPNYSSADVSIRHDGTSLSRMEKVSLIAEWDEALQTLRSCFDAFRPGNVLNCGKCEKCLRTMTGLLIHDRLRACPTYLSDDVSPEMLMSLKAAAPAIPPAGNRECLELAYIMLTRGNIHYWRKLIKPLKKIGRNDLAQVIEDKLEEFQKYHLRMGRKELVKRLDMKYLGSTLVKLNRLVRGIR